ncbi:unnamed protein product [Aphanomyces euteiches]|uniref:RIIa domain-containing protein n=1 Tax=Aphanomyces euteiches TaxID=100861 RepID=A0A6G0WFR0_9STRA|nr:hypothetical protein Ae201684_015932 [Aphanomyces euteiches]KAH9088369.1 hypothetical protein Ae201684P_003063 [Aphanomyces euteiches]KAH9107073.1 hypothetical protein AeMF1_017463 [Aphanomyces euteiches]KAH9129940.1 hypothetical protein LEN26_008967 [Aphanomyces euteiches]KAH9152835.1 hypothetical protein AeRB84_004812 [Aphanomyces euteiches]
MDVLSDEQIAALNQAKVGIRIENEKYIRAHPELDGIMRALIRGVLKDRPSNVTAYAYHFFQRDMAELRELSQKK